MATADEEVRAKTVERERKARLIGCFVVVEGGQHACRSGTVISYTNLGMEIQEQSGATFKVPGEGWVKK